MAVDLGISVVPIPVLMGKETFIAGVDPLSQYYRRLSEGVLPATSAPSPGSFLDVYRYLAREASAIVSVHVMGEKSATLNNARLAAHMAMETIRGLRVIPVDSGNTSMGLGLLAASAARLARAGRTLEDVVHWVEQAVARTEVVAGIREMTMLRRSGRVSLTRALVAGLLKIHPVLRLTQNQIEVAELVRTWPRAVDRLVEMARQTVGDLQAQLAVVHTDCAAEAGQLAQRVRSLLGGQAVTVSDAGPALASHAGAGALGIATLVEPA